MIEAIIEVRIETNLAKANPLHGRVDSIIEHKETMLRDKDFADYAPPYGIMALVKMGGETMSIKANRYAFEGDEGSYSAFFELKGKVYELALNIGEDDTEIDVELREWLDRGEFEDDDDADNVYTPKEYFTFLEKYLS